MLASFACQRVRMGILVMYIMRLIGRVIGSLFRKEGRERATRVPQQHSDLKLNNGTNARCQQTLFPPFFFFSFSFVLLKSHWTYRCYSNTLFSLDLFVLYTFTTWLIVCKYRAPHDRVFKPPLFTVLNRESFDAHPCAPCELIKEPHCWHDRRRFARKHKVYRRFFIFYRLS